MLTERFGFPCWLSLLPVHLWKVSLYFQFIPHLTGRRHTEKIKPSHRQAGRHDRTLTFWRLSTFTVPALYCRKRITSLPCTTANGVQEKSNSQHIIATEDQPIPRTHPGAFHWEFVQQTRALKMQQYVRRRKVLKVVLDRVWFNLEEPPPRRFPTPFLVATTSHSNSAGTHTQVSTIAAAPGLALQLVWQTLTPYEGGCG